MSAPSSGRSTLPPSPHPIVFDAVSVSFGPGGAALRDVTLDIRRGEICCVLGPSGAGKSTLLNLVNGLARPSAGAVWVAGRPAAARRRAGVRPATIHQDGALVGAASVAANIAFGALPETPLWRALIGRPSPAQREKACALAAAVDLAPDLLARRVDTLSGGQRQRVGVARAFMLDPSIVLADEPVASLDPAAARTVLGLLRREARARAATVLCTLHQPDLAAEFADRVVGLADGAVVYDGPPSGFDAPVREAIYRRALA